MIMQVYKSCVMLSFYCYTMKCFFFRLLSELKFWLVYKLRLHDFFILKTQRGDLQKYGIDIIVI